MLCRHWVDWKKGENALQSSIRNVLLRHRRKNCNNSESGSNSNIKSAFNDLLTSCNPSTLKSGGNIASSGLSSSSSSGALGSGSGGDDDLFCMNCNFR